MARTKQEIIDEQAREISALKTYASDLKKRHDKALGALADLSSGLGRKRGESNTWSAAYLAADELRDIAKMPLREVPLW